MYYTCRSALRSLEIAVDRISVITTALNEPGIKKINVRQNCTVSTRVHNNVIHVMLYSIHCTGFLSQNII